MSNYYLEPDQFKDYQNTAISFEHLKSVINKNINKEEVNLLFNTNEAKLSRDKKDFKKSFLPNNQINTNPQGNKNNTRTFNRNVSQNTIKKEETSTFINLFKENKVSFSVLPKQIKESNKNEDNNIQTDFKTNKNSFVPFNFDKISELSNILGFGNYNQFLYLFSKADNTSVGPFSFNELKSLYSLKHIDSTTKCRLLDIFKIKGKAPFDFFEINQLISNDFYDKIESNTWLIQLVDGLKTKQELFKKKKEEVEKLKQLEKIENKKELNEEQKRNEKQVEHNSTSVITKIEDNQPLVSKGSSSNVIKNKKKKGADLDVKLGFYSMSKEEQAYIPHFTAK